MTVRKAQGELGVAICGGNLHGIYVERLEDDSPARAANSLMPGDLILEVSRGEGEMDGRERKRERWGV